jgi:uncharacterized RDD family membrane protein YckC
MSERRLPGERLAGEVAGAVLRGMDLNQVLAGVDLDALIARIDLDAVLARIDIDALVARMDVDALARRIPIEELVGTAPLQRAVDGLNLGPALRSAGLADIVAQSVGRSTLDTVRRRVAVIDALAERLSGGLLRQDIDAWPAGPHALVGDELGPLGDLDAQVDGVGAWNVAGHYVGPLARVLATSLDVFGAISSWSLLTSVVLTLLARAFGLEVDIAAAETGIAFAVGLAAWLGAWFLLPLELFGRTPAMAVLGMRVVTTDGGASGFGRIVTRSIIQIPSVLLLGLGYAVTLFDKRRRTLHDLLSGTSVVWDWGDREATITSPLGRWVAGHIETD